MGDLPDPGMTEANPYFDLGPMDPHGGKAILHWYTADQMKSYALAAVEAERKDAKRYRVLRDARYGFNAYRLQPKPGKRWRGYGDEGDILNGTALDEAIDAAIHASEGGMG